MVKNDSLLCYYYKYKTFSLNYDNQGDTHDLLANAEDTTIPADIEFIRKDSVLYILILTVANDKGQLAPDLLYSLTKR
jgi:hypothetical protein